MVQYSANNDDGDDDDDHNDDNDGDDDNDDDDGYLGEGREGSRRQTRFPSNFAHVAEWRDGKPAR